MSVVSCQLSVGAKHLEDKLSVIAKNSSPNASPVQLLVIRGFFYQSILLGLLAWLNRWGECVKFHSLVYALEQ
ncbi:MULTISPECIES: hypothetical protein [Nostocales]|uniref:hypothetical protein n=1 Tax=Nostocales TaxID=1161 RepID=UPI0009FBFDDB|nr:MULTISPECIES: hypothetical protein [Nostocales]MTJ22479.1 hypothetical protein [Dolichospermum sp. UHCC 0352]MTJ40283.1 hypothetical protein [Dolichospermum sp. UHCC 0406]